jgi:uncharacterized membrane protein
MANTGDPDDGDGPGEVAGAGVIRTGPERMVGLSDGVIAVIITIMVLELAVPHGAELGDLKPLVPKLLAYLLSFVFVGIYWNNHHHLIRATERIDGGVMWANLHLLFWLSLIPFATAWLGEHFGSIWPTFTYGIICVMNAIAYGILVRTITHANPGRPVSVSIGNDTKGNVSVVIYVVACVVAFFAPYVSVALWICVSIIWLVPDRRLSGAQRSR